MILHFRAGAALGHGAVLTVAAVYGSDRAYLNRLNISLQALRLDRAVIATTLLAAQKLIAWRTACARLNSLSCKRNKARAI
jgi:hypothetical protein